MGIGFKNNLKLFLLLRAYRFLIKKTRPTAIDREQRHCSAPLCPSIIQFFLEFRAFNCARYCGGKMPFEQLFLKKKILVIDDDEDLTRLLKLSLEKEGYSVCIAHNGTEGIKAAFELRPHLIVLDLMMPQMDGYETCSRLREMSNIPILLLTARTQNDDIVRGFQEGADDYVTKPFSHNELQARIRALLRRNSYEDESIKKYCDGSLDIDLETQKVFLEGKLLELTTTEFGIFSCLVAHSGQVVPYREIIRFVWGDNYGNAPPLVQTYIAYIRKKLGKYSDDHQYIRTQWGKGYWFAPKEPESH